LIISQRRLTLAWRLSFPKPLYVSCKDPLLSSLLAKQISFPKFSGSRKLSYFAAGHLACNFFPSFDTPLCHLVVASMNDLSLVFLRGAKEFLQL
jgi:hypothetical protein